MRYWKLLVLGLIIPLTASAALVTLGGTSGVEEESGDLPLLAETDITYLGTFTIPPTDGSGAGGDLDDFRYRQGWLVMAPDGTSIYSAGHVGEGLIGRINIPSIGGTATVAQTLQQIEASAMTEHPFPSWGDSQDQNVQGAALIYGGQLVLGFYDYYDGDDDADFNYVTAPLDATSNSTEFVIGSFTGGDVAYNATMAGHIPEEWQDELGGDVWFGSDGGFPILGRHCFGPACVYVGNGADIGVEDPVLTESIVHYTEDNRIAGTGTLIEGDMWNGTTSVPNCAFMPGTSTFLCIGIHGYGTLDYENDYFSSDYRWQAWAFDVADFIQVKLGTMEPYEVEPYAVWQLDPGDVSDTITSPGSATFDPATGRFYVASSGSSPIMYVWEIDLP